jgi:hypothetical protein
MTPDPASRPLQRATSQHPAVRLLLGEQLPELGGTSVEVHVKEHYDELNVEAIVYDGSARVLRRLAWRLEGASVEAALVAATLVL